MCSASAVIEQAYASMPSDCRVTGMDDECGSTAKALAFGGSRSPRRVSLTTLPPGHSGKGDHDDRFHMAAEVSS